MDDPAGCKPDRRGTRPTSGFPPGGGFTAPGSVLPNRSANLLNPRQNGLYRRIGGYNAGSRPAGRTVSNPIIPTHLSCRSLRTEP